MVKNSLETAFEITKLIKNSPTRDGTLRDITTDIEQEEVSDVF